MYTNTTSLDYLSGIIISDVSDHFGTFYISKKKAPDVKSKYSYIRQTKQHNINALKQILSDTDFTPVFSTEDPTESYHTFLDIYKLAYDIACPIKKIKLSNKYIKREPWITQGLIHSSIRKTKLLRAKTRNPSERNINKYKDFCKLFKDTVQMRKFGS